MTGEPALADVLKLSAGPSDFGYRGKISAGYNLGRSSNGSGIDIVAYSTFGYEEQFDQFFGISVADSVSSGLAHPDLDDGNRLSGVEIFYRQNLLKNLQVMASLDAKFYNSDIEQSPLVSDDAEITGGLSVVWRFW